MMSYLIYVEIAVSVITGGLMWQVWNIRASLQATNKSADDAKQNSWDNQQTLKEMQVELARLREEHKDIQGAQNRADENLQNFAKTVGDQVNTIMRDHAEHEVGQAKIEGKLDELIRKS